MLQNYLLLMFVLIELAQTTPEFYLHFKNSSMVDSYSLNFILNCNPDYFSVRKYKN